VVDLDFVLLRRAKRLINGANVHQVNQLILGYELAVSLHNSGPSPHVQYQDQYENAVSTAAMLLERSPTLENQNDRGWVAGDWQAAETVPSQGN
jgi:hypothetical protein